MLQRMIVGTVVLGHVAMLFVGCAWLAGLGDVPLPELPGDGGWESASDEDSPDEDGAAGPTLDDSVADSTDDSAGHSSGDAVVDGAWDSSGNDAANLTWGSSSDSPADWSVDSTAESAAPLNPSMFTGLVLWLDAANGLSSVGGDVSTLAWMDQSGQHNDATSVGAPTIQASAIGGHPAAHFNGATDYFVVQDSASLRFSILDFLIAVVTAHKTPTDAGIGYGIQYAKQILGGPPYGGPALVANAPGALPPGATLWAQVAFQNGSFVQTGEADFNDGRPLCVTMHRRAVGTGLATLTLRINGVDAASATGAGFASDVSATGFPVLIGGTPSQQDVLGDIAEVIAIKGATTDSDVAGLEAYLKGKYGL